MVTRRAGSIDNFRDVSGTLRGFHFWVRGNCVSTVGLDEEKIRAYIRDQELEEKRQEQLPLGGLEPPSPRRPGA